MPEDSLLDMNNNLPPWNSRHPMSTSLPRLVFSKRCQWPGSQPLVSRYGRSLSTSDARRRYPPMNAMHPMRTLRDALSSKMCQDAKIRPKMVFSGAYQPLMTSWSSAELPTRSTSKRSLKRSLTTIWKPALAN